MKKFNMYLKNLVNHQNLKKIKKIIIMKMKMKKKMIMKKKYLLKYD